MVKHENYLNAMAFYKTVKNAAESGTPGADSVLQELASYFDMQKLGGKKTAQKR